MNVAASRWSTIYQDHARYVFRVIHARVVNRADAEDLTAEVFARTINPLRANASDAEVRGYLLATARTVLAGHWERNARLPVTVLPDDVPSPAPAPVSAASSRRVRAILDALPERYRRILELRFLCAMTLRETAAELGISVANAKVLQHRALARAARTAPCEAGSGTS